MSYVFLSHSHKDKEFARRLAASLRHTGHIVWVDEAEILVGDSLIDKIREGLDRVDYVLALLTRTSIESEWVKKELDVAMSREIQSKRVVVLPALLHDVELPGFLKGKRYADFRDSAHYDRALKDVLAALGRADPPPNLSQEEIGRLQDEVAAAKALADHYAKDLERQRSLISSHQSENVRAAIAEANKKFPQHRAINEAYAFEAGNMPVTLDYLMWAIAKGEIKGAHPLATLIALDDKWGNVRMMLEAYQDYVTGPRSDGPNGRPKRPRPKRKPTAR
jgi:hypothetical protein